MENQEKAQLEANKNNLYQPQFTFSQ